MRKVTVHEPIIIAQSTTAPILFGGHQDPAIRINEKKEIFVRYHAHKDCHAEAHLANLDPVLCSKDGGVTWEQVDNAEWIKAGPKMANGDWYGMRGRPIITDLPDPMPAPREDRRCKIIANTTTLYTAEELAPYFPDEDFATIGAYRIKAGTDEVLEETDPVDPGDLPTTVAVFDNYVTRGGGSYYSHVYNVDKNGTAWMPVYGGMINADGTLGSDGYLGIRLLRSDDNGYHWKQVGVIPFKKDYVNPNAIDIEGFNESTLEILDDGTFFLVMRAGSLHPFEKGDPDHPAPQIFCTRSTDQGKTWETPKPFYDYGILPCSVRLGCGTYVLVSGRPGVYIRTCDDPTAREWNDVIQILPVPEKDVYDAYYEYSCSNCGICAYDDHTAFITYSDFQRNAPDGKRAKSIIVRKITVE